MKRKIKFLVYPLAVIIVSMFIIVGCNDDDPEPINPPTLTTLAVTDITETLAKSGGNITDDGGGEITARGVVWGTEVNPTLENHSGVTVDGAGSGVFQSNITGLSAGTTYYVRAYATNSAGTSYGNDVTFETEADEDDNNGDDEVTEPTVTTANITNISENSATGGGNVTDDGGATVTARGIVYSTNQNPTISDNVVSAGSGTGSFTANMVELQPNTLYYVRAYATNSEGTSYGNEVMFETEQSEYLLTIEVSPQDAGSVTGAGSYTIGEQVIITATANDGWEFVNWTGDTEHLDDADSLEAVVTMPADDVTLTAVFQQKDDSDIIYGDGVIDIDGNEYVTVIIGNQEWMAENLRVTKYNNGVTIPTGLSDEDWGNTTEGAYAIYDHNAVNTDGINSPEEMVAAYGKLYNCYAVDDSRGFCPQGWSVPSDADWTQLVDYVVSMGFPNSWNDPNGAGNALKSCRQVGHPDGGDCATSEHPRWDSDGTHSGFDEFGFSAFPGGYRGAYGGYSSIGRGGYWWSSSELSSGAAWYRDVLGFSGSVNRRNGIKRFGFSVRCVKTIE